MSRVDIHCHLLPGVDDGARDVPESLAMAATAVRDGTSIVVATPHLSDQFPLDVSELPGRATELREALDRERIPLAIQVAGELQHSLVGQMCQHELEGIALGPPGCRWLLVEAPFAGLDEEFHLAADELRDRGFGVLIAHPERSADLLGEGGGALMRELGHGSLLQVNVWSVAGGYGAVVEATAGELLRRGVVTALASDSHPGWRTPLLSIGLEAVRGCGIGELGARRLVDVSPARLLRNGIAKETPRTPLTA